MNKKAGSRAVIWIIVILLMIGFVIGGYFMYNGDSSKKGDAGAGDSEDASGNGVIETSASLSESNYGWPAVAKFEPVENGLSGKELLDYYKKCNLSSIAKISRININHNTNNEPGYVSYSSPKLYTVENSTQIIDDATHMNVTMLVKSGEICIGDIDIAALSQYFDKIGIRTDGQWFEPVYAVMIPICIKGICRIQEIVENGEKILVIEQRSFDERNKTKLNIARMEFFGKSSALKSSTILVIDGLSDYARDKPIGELLELYGLKISYYNGKVYTYTFK